MNKGIHPDLEAKALGSPEHRFRVIITYSEAGYQCLVDALDAYSATISERFDVLKMVVTELTIGQMKSLVKQCEGLKIDDGDRQVHT